MGLIKTSLGIADIRGSVGGVYFHRDNSGLHVCNHPRVIYRRSPAQDRQRKAFIAARSLSSDKRTVSYLIYRWLNGLPITVDPEWISPTNFIRFVWVNGNRAIDGNPISNASYNIDPGGRSPFLTLTHPSIYCSRIRFDVFKSPNPGAGVDVDVLQRGEWLNVYPSGDGFGNDYNDHTWTEKSFPFTYDLVTQVRIRFDNPFEFAFFHARVYEVEVWSAPPHWPVPIEYQIPRM